MPALQGSSLSFGERRCPKDRGVRCILAFCFILVSFIAVRAQIFEVDTLQYSGDADYYINFVIMGDGYTADQQSKFIDDATSLSNLLLNEIPWRNYRNYFNVFAIKVISADSGARHPNNAADCSSASPLVPTSNANTYFGSTFDAFGLHRLVEPQNTGNVTNVLAANFPNYDQVLIIVNSPYYGGSGGQFATSTMDVFAYNTTSHELGHSFAHLSDEYYAGDNYAAETPNMTQETDTSLVKWKNWLGYKGTGIYRHCCGGNSATWYKPDKTCKMEISDLPYCEVCKQTIVESIHELVNPVVNYTPAVSNINTTGRFIDFKLTELMKPVPNTLKIEWQLDGISIESNIDSFQLDQNTIANGNHTLIATVADTTNLLRVDGHADLHYSTVIWSVRKGGGTVGVIGINTSEVSVRIYPNPASDVVNVSFNLDKQSTVTIQLLSVDGKVVKEVNRKTFQAGGHTSEINIQNLSSGTYFLKFHINGYIYSETIIKP